MKKIALRLAAMIMLFGIFGFSTTSIAEATHPDVITVQYNDLTPQQKEVIQKGEPNYELLDGERIILVYDYNKEACQLPKTGTNSMMIMVSLGILALTGAGYFLVSNKNGKKFILIVGLVLSGVAASTSLVSAGVSIVEEDCTIYIGYIRENSTTTTTEASTTAEVTTSETTTEEQSTTTTETTTETTTTEETTTEQTYTVVPTDHF
ncbi:MAG: LPXTG cell wall anchor domain-containing protein [Streptococcus sp.]|nr:LPXTG cell wall anchor domain-containing protein [Streptococcus sp.]